jgi:hypothetical protein
MGVHEIVFYRGFVFRLIVIKAGGSKYSWRFEIEGGSTHICEHAPLDSELEARDEALAEAKSTVDGMRR